MNYNTEIMQAQATLKQSTPYLSNNKAKKLGLPYYKVVLGRKVWHNLKDI